VRVLDRAREFLVDNVIHQNFCGDAAAAGLGLEGFW